MKRRKYLTYNYKLYNYKPDNIDLRDQFL